MKITAEGAYNLTFIKFNGVIREAVVKAAYIADEQIAEAPAEWARTFRDIARRALASSQPGEAA